MRYWVVKGKPGNLGEHEDYGRRKRVTWQAGRLPKDLRRDDRIFLWQSSPAKRLVALARVAEVNVGTNRAGKTLFDLVYLTPILQEQIAIDELREYYSINEASFLKSGPFATVYPLDKAQGEDLFRIVAVRNPDIWRVWPDISIREPERVGRVIASSILPPPLRVEVIVNRIIRDTAESKRLKDLYGNRCQVCNERIEIAEKRFYSETHHIRPLGGIHRGLDHAGNMLVLCPNHHAMFDFGVARFISETSVHIGSRHYPLTTRHKLYEKCIRYHNKRIFGR